MKKNIFILLSFFFICSLSSCRDELLERSLHDNISSNVKEFYIEAFVQQHHELSPFREAASKELEDRILNDYLLLFDKDGVRIPMSQIKITKNVGSLNRLYKCHIQNGAKTYDEIKALVVANYGKDYQFMFNWMEETDLNAIRHISEVSNALHTNQSLERISAFFMTAFEVINFKNVACSTDNASNLPPKQYLRDGIQTIRLPLKRTVAKVQFEVMLNEDNTLLDNPNATFTPTFYRFVNIPNSTRIIPSEDDSWRTPSDYNPRPQSVEISDPSWHSFEGEHSFVSYIPENRRKFKKEITPAEYTRVTKKNMTDPSDLYFLRAHRSKTHSSKPGALSWEVENGEFDFADPYTTYIEILGDYKEKIGVSTKFPKGAERISKGVHFTIPLGYVDIPGRSSKLNNYDVVRNTFYKYKMHIQGINNIVLEVNTNNEQQNHDEFDSLAEGNVKDTSAKIVDAHYSTCVIKISKALITSPNQTIAYSIWTPFDKNEEGRDINWITFQRNENYGSWGQKKYHRFIRDYNKNAQLSIDDLVNDIKRFYNKPNGEGFWDTEGNAYFSCYINEYYYETPPQGYSGPYASNWAKNGWREFVNQPDRTISIFLDGKKQDASADNKSFYSQPDIFISQRSIRTPIEPDMVPRDAITFGFETIDETPEIQHRGQYLLHRTLRYGSEKPTLPYNNDINKQLEDGYRMSMFYMELMDRNGNFKRGKRWSQYYKHLQNTDERTNQPIDVYYLIDGPSTFADRSSLFYECMRRNRDLNGNGTIEEEEMRWYLPSYRELLVEQLSSNVLPPYERLFPPKNLNSEDIKTRKGPLYMTSAPTQDAAQFFWSGEGYTIGRSAITPWTDTDSPFSVRCSRRLGVRTDTPEHFHQDNRRTNVRLVHVDFDEGVRSFYNGVEIRESEFGRPEEYSSRYFDDNGSQTYSMKNAAIIFDMRRFHHSSIRSVKINKGGLPRHFAHSKINRPYKKMRLAAHSLMTKKGSPAKYTTGYLSGGIGNMENYCSKYYEIDRNGREIRNWRAPNAAEMAIALSYEPFTSEDNKGWGTLYNGSNNGSVFINSKGQSFLLKHLVTTYFLEKGKKIATGRYTNNDHRFHRPIIFGYEASSRTQGRNPEQFTIQLNLPYYGAIRCVKDVD